MVWGTLASSETVEGASGRSWTLRFERRLAPRESSKTANPASSVWLVRDEQSARLYAAKRQALASLEEVDALVDEAAAWRAACLADTQNHIVELVDVFVDRQPPFAVTFLAEFCARGLLPKRGLSEAVLLTIAADLARAASVMPTPHAHIAHDSLLVDDLGRIRLSGFGAHRSAILRDNVGLAPSDDAFDIGLLLYELIFGVHAPESLEIPNTSAYSAKIIDLVAMAFSHPPPTQLFDRAVAAGAEARAPVVDVQRKDDTPAPVAEHVARATDRNIDRLVTGVDIAPAFAALLEDLKADPDSVSSSIFSALFQKPMSKDPLIAMRALTMLHNLILDGPEALMACVRKNDKFMGWTEASWTREAIESTERQEDQHPATVCFAGGDLAFYASFLRRKAKFHMLAAGAFSGGWNRTGAAGSDGRDALVTRRRKVVSGMADLIEMASELGCRLAGAVDAEKPVKQTSLGALVSECGLAYNAAIEMSHEVETVRDAEKLVPGIARIYAASRALVFAVEHVPSAGGEQWVQQFGEDAAPDIVANAERKEQEALGASESGEFPEEGWGEAEELVDEKAAEKKRRKEERNKKRMEKEAKKAEKKAKAAEAEEQPSAADGALVVHGADDAAAKVQTMFGDLLAIDDNKREVEPSQADDGPLPDMSNAQALASAFGVPEEAVGGQYAALPSPEGFADDDDGDGAYDDFKARQQHNAAEHSRVRERSNTAAWAARAGYGERALVLSKNNEPPKKSHPTFCQCALCEKEEAQATASASEPGRSGAYQAGAENDQYTGVRKDSRNEESMYQKPDAKRSSGRQKKSYYDEEYEDSLDSKEGGNRDPDEQRRTGRSSYYQDDYDSYESVTYSVEHDQEPTNRNDALNGDEEESMFPSFGPPPPKLPFTVDKKMILNMKKLRTGDKISETLTVSVSKGEYNREQVAIKRLTKKGVASTEAVEELTNEVMVMCNLSHPRILPCMAALLQKPNYVFVTEHMKRGTLFDVLHKHHIKLTWALVKKIAIQLAEGMTHVHDKGFLHCDLKSLNVFVDGSYNIKIGDFGLSRALNGPYRPGISGTYQYLAPEVLIGGVHSFKSDIFSYAHILCEMVSGQPPFHGMDPQEVAERVAHEDIRPQIPPNCPRDFARLIQTCWDKMSVLRPPFSDIVQVLNKTIR